LKVVKATLIDKLKFKQLLNQYLLELKTHHEYNVGYTDTKTYRYLDSYWNEKGRHPFLFYLEDQLVGFSLIRDTESTGSECSQVSELYILPDKRLQGNGKKAAIEIFDLFPGKWELQTHNKNKTGIRFWENCIRSKAKYEPSVSKITAPDGKRTQYNFTV
jgi:predicted acetyltransferase